MPHRFWRPQETSRILLAASAAVVLTVAGCEDVNTTDRQLRQELEVAQHLQPEESRVQVEAIAARAQQASPAVRAVAKSAQAHSELTAANEAMARLRVSELQAADLITEIVQLTGQIQTGKVLATGYQKLEPSAAVKNVQEKIAEAQGGQQRSAWISTPAAQIPTIAATRQEASRLEGQITERQQRIASLQQRRTQTLEESERAAQSAEQAQGEQALEEYRRASNLRREAAVLSIEIDQIRAELLPLEQQLALTQTQQQGVTRAVQQFQVEQQNLETGWKQVQAQSQQQLQITQQIMGSAQDVGSIAGKAEQLNAVLNEIMALRETALQNANNAVSFSDAAADAGAEVVRQMDDALRNDVDQARVERPAWEASRRVHHPSNYRLEQAIAERAVGNLMLSAARTQRLRLQAQQTLSQAVQGLQISVPEALQQENLEERATESVTLASEAFQRADDLLENITTGDAARQLPHLDNAARIGRVLTLYDRAQVARLAGRNEDARAFIAAAVELRNELASRRVTMPAFPTELGQPPAAPAAPATEGFGMAR
jgi:hypothetical protein